MSGLLRRIFDYLRAIAWVVVPFCMIASLHYLFVFFPRSVNENDNHIYFNNLGLDYWGVIVGFFTLIVTLLVGWQIFSTIRERERNERLEEQYSDFKNEMIAFRNGLEQRIKNMEDCCSEQKEQIENLDSKVEYLANATLLVMSAESLIKSAHFTDKKQKTDNFLISIAYSSLFNATYQFIKGHSDKKNILGCVSKIKTCLMMLSVDNLGFIKENYDTASKWFEAIKALKPNDEIMKELDLIHREQEKIGWDKDYEERHEGFRRFQEWQEKQEAVGGARTETAEACGGNITDSTTEE